MYKLVGEAVETVGAVKPLVANANHCEVIVAPPFTALRTVADRLEGSRIKLAAQDVCDVTGFGARTGEVSAAMIRDVGCEYVIIGHSERRQFYGETNQSVNLKLRAALGVGLKPVVCVGERLEEREAGRAEAVVKTQLAEGVVGLTVQEVSHIIIAYEPVWAIGTGRTAGPEQAQAMHAFIRRNLAELFGNEVADQVRVLYGGSVKPDNIAALMREPDIDGALVGGASLDAKGFAEIVNYVR
jgi:triosephosphate isomerase